MDQKQKRMRQKERQDYRQKNKRDIEKWDQTDSPEIADRGETSEIPGLPSGVHFQGWPVSSSVPAVT